MPLNKQKAEQQYFTQGYQKTYHCRLMGIITLKDVMETLVEKEFEDQDQTCQKKLGSFEEKVEN